MRDMVILLFIVLAGTLFSYLALQNTTPVTVFVFQYTFSFVPLYVVGLLSLLVGLSFGWLFTLKQKFFTSRLLHGKEKSIDAYKEEVTQIRKRLHDIENENDHLRELTGHDMTDEKSL